MSPSELVSNPEGNNQSELKAAGLQSVSPQMELRDKDESLLRKSRAPLNQDLAASRTPKEVEIVKLDHSK